MPISLFEQFLDNPCLRLTPSFCQNDPFEFGYTNEDISELNKIYNHKSLGQSLEKFSKSHGIVSLSKTNSSIPMWTHYTNNHKGFVIELKIDVTEPEKLFVNGHFKHLKTSTPDYLFDKVRYKNIRGISSDIRDMDFEDIREHYYFTKAEDWFYEKEYRFILPFTWTNRIIFSQKGLQRAKKYLDGYKFDCLNPECDKEENKKYEIDPCAIVTIIGRGDTELLEKVWLNSKESDTIFLCKLDTDKYGYSSTEKLGNIYLGYNCNEERVKKYLIQDIHSHYYYIVKDTVINVKNCDIDKNKYEMIFHEIN